MVSFLVNFLLIAKRLKCHVHANCYTYSIFSNYIFVIIQFSLPFKGHDHELAQFTWRVDKYLHTKIFTVYFQPSLIRAIWIVKNVSFVLSVAVIWGIFWFVLKFETILLKFEALLLQWSAFLNVLNFVLLKRWREFPQKSNDLQCWL